MDGQNMTKALLSNKVLSCFTLCLTQQASPIFDQCLFQGSVHLALDSKTCGPCQNSKAKLLLSKSVMSLVQKRSADEFQ